MAKRIGGDSINDEIDCISTAARRLLECDPATRKAILLLVAHVAGMKEKHVKKALEATREISRKYLVK